MSLRLGIVFKNKNEECFYAFSGCGLPTTA